MDVVEMIEQAKDAIAVKRVYGEPYEKEGLTFIPAAVIGGGGGAGTGERAAEDKGAGGGFGFGARPVGAFVIKDGDVRWRPAPDLNRVILGAQLLVAVGLFTVGTIVRARQKNMRRQFWLRRLWK